MGTLTAANNARTFTAMDRRNLDVDGVAYTITELLNEGRISYIRVRTMRDGKRTYGIILHDDVMTAHNDERFATLAEALAYVPFHEVPKMVTDYLHTEGISRVAFNTSEETFSIESAS